MKTTFRLSIQPGYETAAMLALLDFVDMIRGVAGNLSHIIEQNEAQPGILLIHEDWVDMQSCYAFMNSAWTMQFMQMVGPYLISMEQIEN